MKVFTLLPGVALGGLVIAALHSLAGCEEAPGPHTAESKIEGLWHIMEYLVWVHVTEADGTERWEQEDASGGSITFTDGTYISADSFGDVLQTGSYEMISKSRILFLPASSSRSWVATYSLDGDDLTLELSGTGGRPTVMKLKRR